MYIQIANDMKFSVYLDIQVVEEKNNHIAW